MAALAAAAGCAGAARTLGPTRAEAALRADALIEALGFDLGPVDRDRAVQRVQAGLARAALAPSRLFGNASLWTASGAHDRTLGLAGVPTAGRLRLTLQREPPPPRLPGEYRAVYRLRRIARGEYAWRVADELALGPLAPDDVAHALANVLATATQLSGAEARERLRQELPRSAAAAGRLYRLDTLDIRPAPDGSVAVTVAVRLDPAGIRAELPRYAAYLAKYVVPVRLDVVASDPGGARWWEAHSREGRTRVRLRIHAGSLAPLSGPPRPLPDRIQVDGDLSMKAGLFRVGLRDLEADVSLDRGPGRKGFVARFRRQPRWELPLLLEPLLRSSLRRPFQGEGAWTSLVLQPGEGGSGVLVNEYELTVKESWIVRWLGGLFGSAVAEYRSGADEESDRFLGALLGALRADVRALLAPAAGPPSSRTPGGDSLSRGQGRGIAASGER